MIPLPDEYFRQVTNIYSGLASGYCALIGGYIWLLIGWRQVHAKYGPF
jgi:hypothetical protein